MKHPTSFQSGNGIAPSLIPFAYLQENEREKEWSQLELTVVSSNNGFYRFWQLSPLPSLVLQGAMALLPTSRHHSLTLQPVISSGCRFICLPLLIWTCAISMSYPDNPQQFCPKSLGLIAIFLVSSKDTFYFSVMYVFVCQCVNMCTMHTGTCISRKRPSNPLDLEL